jgi:hypothetical protein
MSWVKTRRLSRFVHRATVVLVLRTPGAIRTRTVDVLNIVPLPLGYEGMVVLRAAAGIRTRDLRHGEATL